MKLYSSVLILDLLRKVLLPLWEKPLSVSSWTTMMWCIKQGKFLMVVNNISREKLEFLIQKRFSTAEIAVLLGVLYTITLLRPPFWHTRPIPHSFPVVQIVFIECQVGYDVIKIVIIYVKCYKPAEIITITTTTIIIIIIIIILIRLN